MSQNLAPWTIANWVEKVQAAAPPPKENGLPVLPDPAFAVPGFEEILPGNYIQIDLGCFNWNHRDSKVQRQSAYGWNSRHEMPVQRISAADMVATFQKADRKKTASDRQSEVRKTLEVISHPRLRETLEKENSGETPGAAVAQALTQWLRKAIKGSCLGKSSYHPADQARIKAINDFVHGVTDAIPVVIGVRIKYPWLKANMDLYRIDSHNGNILHRYVADPSNQGIIVAYGRKNGKVCRDKPLTLKVRQSGAIIPEVKALGEVPPGPLHGRAFGQPRVALAEWNNALKHYLRSVGIAEYIFVTQGCVIYYEDGSQKYLRNFSSSYGFTKSLLKGIIGIKHSPFAKRSFPPFAL